MHEDPAHDDEVTDGRGVFVGLIGLNFDQGLNGILDFGPSFFRRHGFFIARVGPGFYAHSYDTYDKEIRSNSDKASAFSAITRLPHLPLSQLVGRSVFSFRR